MGASGAGTLRTRHAGSSFRECSLFFPRFGNLTSKWGMTTGQRRIGPYVHDDCSRAARVQSEPGGNGPSLQADMPSLFCLPFFHFPFFLRGGPLFLFCAAPNVQKLRGRERLISCMALIPFFLYLAQWAVCRRAGFYGFDRTVIWFGSRI